MKHAISVERVLSEVRAIAEFQNVDRAELERALGELMPHLNQYAELSLTERGVEILTGSKGEGAARSLSEIARRHGGLDSVAEAFLACDALFPGRMLGLKLCFGPDASPPSLYHRTMTPKSEALDFLASVPELANAITTLGPALEESRTVYALGFIPVRGEVGLKVYTIGDVRANLGGQPFGGARTVDGFVSYRVSKGITRPEIKRYLTDTAWERVAAKGARWPALIRFVKDALGYERAAYLGLLESEGAAPELKLYIERIGAIPTEYAAR